MADVTFRDFTAALMQGNKDGASAMLEPLLGLTGDAATKATDHFHAHLQNPTFMGKAMNLRKAVESGTDQDIADSLGEAFGLDEAQRTAAVAAVRKRYPKS